MHRVKENRKHYLSHLYNEWNETHMTWQKKKNLTQFDVWFLNFCSKNGQAPQTTEKKKCFEKVNYFHEILHIW